MRLKLTLEHPPNQVLPVNYQYLISSWIYRTLGNADAEYAQQLHNHGYPFGDKKYKLFTFGPLVPSRYYLDAKDRTFTLQEGPTTLMLSFLIDEAVQHFVVGLFKDEHFELRSGGFNAICRVSGVEVLPKPDFTSTMRFRLLTPICISESVEYSRHAQYRKPTDYGYSRLLLNNLLRKQHALQAQLVSGEENPIIKTPPHLFQLCSAVKKQPRFFKGNKYIAYQFDFELTAPIELLELGYYAGFGEKNSGMGLGMVEML